MSEYHIYDFKIQCPLKSDEEAWELCNKLERVVLESDHQLNFITLSKDQKDYPRSKKEYDYRNAEDKRKKKLELDLALSNAEDEVRSLKRQLIKLSEEMK